jgi:hypothetical protein
MQLDTDQAWKGRGEFPHLNPLSSSIFPPHHKTNIFSKAVRYQGVVLRWAHSSLIPIFSKKREKMKTRSDYDDQVDCSTFEQVK